MKVRLAKKIVTRCVRGDHDGRPWGRSRIVCAFYTLMRKPKHMERATGMGGWHLRLVPATPETAAGKMGGGR